MDDDVIYWIYNSNGYIVDFYNAQNLESGCGIQFKCVNKGKSNNLLFNYQGYDYKVITYVDGIPDIFLRWVQDMKNIYLLQKDNEYKLLLIAKTPSYLFNKNENDYDHPSLNFSAHTR